MSEIEKIKDSRKLSQTPINEILSDGEIWGTKKIKSDAERIMKLICTKKSVNYFELPQNDRELLLVNVICAMYNAARLTHGKI